jgi:hypothetical protein
MFLNPCLSSDSLRFCIFKGLVELLLGCLHLGRVYVKESCHEMDIFFLNAL